MKLYCLAPAHREPDNEHGCRTCNGHLGQSPINVVWIGVVVERTPRKPLLEQHKDVRRCPKCGIWNIYLRRGVANNV